MQQAQEHTAPPQRTYHFKSTQLNRLSGANDGWRNMVDHITNKQNAGHAPDRNFCHSCLAMICAGITPDKSLQDRALKATHLLHIFECMPHAKRQWATFYNLVEESHLPNISGAHGAMRINALMDFLRVILPDEKEIRERLRENFSRQMLDEQTPPQNQLFNI